MGKLNKILFSQEEELKDMMDIGAGFALKKVSQIHIEIYSPNGFYKAVELKPQINKRLLVVELVNKHGVSKSLLAKALEISRQSIDNWLASQQKWGYEGLINSTKSKNNTSGPKRPAGNKARQLEEERRKEREAIEKEEENDNIPLNFPGTEGDQKDGPDIFNGTHEFEENRYAGSFLYWGMFQHYYRFMDFIESHLGKYAMVVYLYAMMQINRLASIEQLKTVFKREFGRILGLRKLFCIPVLWGVIHSCSQLKASSKTLEEFFFRQGQLGLVSLGQLYIDGHFIPYYGKEDVNKGYYTQRSMMLSGQTEIFVHDINGEIVYSEMQEGKGDIVSVLEKMNHQWTPYLGGLPPLLTVDRELWSVKTFLLLKKKKARFVTWEKYTPEGQLDSIDADKFSQSFEMNDIEYRVYETSETCEASKVYKDADNNQVKLRRIVLWNKKANKRMAVVSNDELEDSITIAQAMLNRWGVNENGFKHMGNRINLHYNPVLDISLESQMQMVANPKCKQLRKKKKELKKEIGKIEKKLLKLAQKKDFTGFVESVEKEKNQGNEKNTESRKGKKSKRNESWKELETHRDDLLNELKEVDSQLSETPEKIKLSELKEGRSFKLISTEGKNLWDLSQALVWNSRKKLTQEFGRFLSNKRDLIPALEAITRCRGWIKSTSRAIIVKLEPLDTHRFRVAQIQFCRALNQKNIRLKNGKQIIYSVTDTTKNVQKNGAKSNQIKEV